MMLGKSDAEQIAGFMEAEDLSPAIGEHDAGSHKARYHHEHAIGGVARGEQSLAGFDEHQLPGVSYRGKDVADRPLRFHCLRPVAWGPCVGDHRPRTTARGHIHGVCSFSGRTTRALACIVLEWMDGAR
jgi:hypothetical protein